MYNKDNKLIWEKYVLRNESNRFDRGGDIEDPTSFSSEFSKAKPVSMDELPEFINIDNILTTDTEYIGGNSDEEIRSYFKDAVITQVAKEYGYGDNFRRSTPDDFYYLVTVKYKCEHEHCLAPYMNLIIGVSKDGTNRQVFQS
jgi:hypothetical protein